MTSVGGTNFQAGVRRGSGSYYFSKYMHCWGWGTWRRAWRAYDLRMPLWPAARDAGVLEAVCRDPAERAFWDSVFEKTYDGEIDTWDYPWQLCCWLQNGLTALPNRNLVTNVGFGPGATHTTEVTALADRPVRAAGRLVHPPFVLADVRADAVVADLMRSAPLPPPAAEVAAVPPGPEAPSPALDRPAPGRKRVGRGGFVRGDPGPAAGLAGRRRRRLHPPRAPTDRPTGRPAGGPCRGRRGASRAPRHGRRPMNVALLIFNRPGVTARVFAAVRAARPARLFVIADGPRPGRPGEADAVAATRAVTDAVDWPCEVTRLYSDRNLGCAARVASGLDAVFGAVEDAVILEDDCLPHPAFFPYCAALLDRYRDDERVMAVCGSDLRDAAPGPPPSAAAPRTGYRFSRYPLCWGWATWARAWRHYDPAPAAWPAARDAGALAAVVPDPADRAAWDGLYDAVARGEVNSWAYPWQLCVWLQHGLSVHPNANLVSNVGFGGAATHTRKTTPLSGLPTADCGPLPEPPALLPDPAGDAAIARIHAAALGPAYGPDAGPDAGGPADTLNFARHALRRTLARAARPFRPAPASRAAALSRPGSRSQPGRPGSRSQPGRLSRPGPRPFRSGPEAVR